MVTAEHSMTNTQSARRHFLGGATRIFLADALLLPTGLLTAVYLTRRLGATDYGLFALVLSVVFWGEGILAAVLNRATIKFIADVSDWRQVGAGVLQLYLGIGIFVAIGLAISAGGIAERLDAPLLAPYLRLFALDVPIFSLAQAHRSILTATGGYGERAITGATHWIARLLFVVLFVELGLSVTGAILGNLGASLIELGIARWFIRPSFRLVTGIDLRPWANSALSLIVVSIVWTWYDKLGILALKGWGGTAQQAGLYAAAQNLTVVPMVFALSFSPVLLSRLGQIQRERDDAGARALAREVLRFVVLLLPFAAITTAASSEIVLLVYGAPFLEAAPIVAWLIWGAWGLLLIAVTSSILMAAGNPNLSFLLATPSLLLSLVGYALAVPRWGAEGAAIVTTLGIFFSAMALTASAHWVWRIAPAGSTLLKSLLVSGLGFTLSALPAPVWLVLPKLAAVAIVCGIAFLLLGELKVSALAALGSRIPD
jgi:O-antigen/teichoic acid export membrane protein